MTLNDYTTSKNSGDDYYQESYKLSSMSIFFMIKLISLQKVSSVSTYQCNQMINTNKGCTGKKTLLNND